MKKKIAASQSPYGEICTLMRMNNMDDMIMNVSVPLRGNMHFNASIVAIVGMTTTFQSPYGEIDALIYEE